LTPTAGAPEDLPPSNVLPSISYPRYAWHVIGPETIVVRPSRRGESPLVSSILLEAAEWLRERGDPLWSIPELEPDAISIDVDAGCYLLAFAGEEAVGTARLTRDDPLFWPDAVPGEAAYLHRLAVRRSQAGGSLSRIIVTWASAHARSLGCTYLRLDCDAARRRLRSMYEAMGFIFHSERVVGPYTVARYQKALANSC
jgi:GNAT superfamily N-acetyltransferase